MRWRSKLAKPRYGRRNWRVMREHSAAVQCHIGLTGYVNKAAAKRGARQIRAGAAAAELHDLSPYHCPECGFWHLRGWVEEPVTAQDDQGYAMALEAM